MKEKMIVLLLICFTGLNMKLFAQGKYAGAQKALIGKTFTDERHLAGLKGYSFRQADMITDVNDAQPQFLTIYVKGTQVVVVYSAKADTATKKFSIIDVIEITGVLPGWEVKTTGCKNGQTENEIIIALVKTGKKQYATTVKKAWLCERDRLKIEAIGIKNISCLNEGFENE